MFGLNTKSALKNADGKTQQIVETNRRLVVETKKNNFLGSCLMILAGGIPLAYGFYIIFIK